MAFSIFPHTVYQATSKISGSIEVKEQFGRYTLHVKGMIQSGGLVRSIWKKVLSRVQNQMSGVKKVLVLGLGGGTVVRLIDEMLLGAQIVGVEIDPEVVKIGKKFFGLDEIKNLEIITADALKWLGDFDHLNHRSKYDLIIVDLYLGDKFPKKAESEEFLKNIKNFLSKDGIAIFNRLKTDKSEGFKKKLKKHFPCVDLFKTSTNLLFLARSQ